MCRLYLVTRIIQNVAGEALGVFKERGNKTEVILVEPLKEAIVRALARGFSSGAHLRDVFETAGTAAPYIP